MKANRARLADVADVPAAATDLEAIAYVVDGVIARRLEPVIRLLEQLKPPALTPPQRDVLTAVMRLFNANEPFTSADVVSAARFDREAAGLLGRAVASDTQRLGIVLRQIADIGAIVEGIRLVRLPPEAGARRWTLEAVDSR